jgi:hypothetical protein
MTVGTLSVNAIISLFLFCSQKWFQKSGNTAIEVNNKANGIMLKIEIEEWDSIDFTNKIFIGFNYK